MTIHIPENNLIDKILSYFGKKRGVIIPDKIYDEFGHYTYVKVKRESFWKALLRPASAALPNGVFDWDNKVDTIQPNHNRREVLFCHNLLSFIETEFKGIVFKDDLPGQSRTEIYFIFNKAYYLVEAKSEVETEGSKHPGWKGTFQNVRDAIRNLSIDNQYNKWLLYLAQLNDYASPDKRSKEADDFSERFVILGLPLSKLSDCQKAIKLTLNKLSITDFNFTSRKDIHLGVSYVLMKERELSSLIQSILKNIKKKSLTKKSSGRKKPRR